MLSQLIKNLRPFASIELFCNMSGYVSLINPLITSLHYLMKTK